jgi:type I restriction enzyme M protein
VNFYGQEMTRTTYNLARMNMILHDVHYRRFRIEHDDTLENPKHLDLRFEAIVANPPFSAQWKGDDNPLYCTDERFSHYGKLAPKTKPITRYYPHDIPIGRQWHNGLLLRPMGYCFEVPPKEPYANT